MVFQVSSPIHLKLGAAQQWNGLSYQVLSIELVSPDRLISPPDLASLPLPPGINTTGGVIVTGRAPIWLYAALVHELHPTAWVACFDPRLNGGVVVATHSRQTSVGQVIPLPPPTPAPRLNPGLMIVGPPDSGKSVLSHALFTALLPQHPDIFLQRANWDGEGNWLLELPSTVPDTDRDALKQEGKGSPSDRFFGHHGQAILQLRRQKPLVLVDVGGKVQPTKAPLLEACSHYVVISSQRDRVEEWHEFCCDRGNLKCLAVIHSTLEADVQIHRWQPYLEISCGPWVLGQSPRVPGVLLEQVQALLGVQP